MRESYEQILVSELQPYPSQIVVFHDEPIDVDFINSIKAEGVLAPLIVTQDRIILSGHRRHAAAIASQIERVPCRVLSVDSGSLQAFTIWQQSNQQRILTAEQKARIVQERLRLESKLANERKTSGTGQVYKDDHEELVPHGRSPQARDIAGEAVGWSGRTVDHAVAAVEIMDELASEGHGEAAEEIREVLNTRGPKPAAKKAKEIKEQVEQPEVDPLDAILAEDLPTKPVEPEEMLDAYGWPIPDNLKDIFLAADNFRDVLNTLTQARKGMNCLLEMEVVNTYLDKNAIDNYFGNLRCQITHGIPYLVCQDCGGKGCPHCKYSGFLVKSQADRMTTVLKKKNGFPKK